MGEVDLVLFGPCRPWPCLPQSYGYQRRNIAVIVDREPGRHSHGCAQGVDAVFGTAPDDLGSGIDSLAEQDELHRGGLWRQIDGEAALEPHVIKLPAHRGGAHALGVDAWRDDEDEGRVHSAASPA